MVIGDKGKIQEKKNEISNHIKDGPTKTKETKTTKTFSTKYKKKKRRVKYVTDTKEKRKKKEGQYIQRLNDLSKPMPKRF